MSFRQLCAAATVIRGEPNPLHLVHEWSAKRETLSLQLLDLPALVSDFKRTRTEPHPTKPGVVYLDGVPSLRLANACESICHGLYATAEVAAGFANKVSKGALPSSFNAIRKKVRAGEGGSDLAAALPDLEWYERVRELRTEWTHHSSVFIGGGQQGEPLFAVRSYRRQSDKEHFVGLSQHPVSEIARWIANAISLLDGFGVYLLRKYVLPSFEMDAPICVPRRDVDGTPIFLGGGRIEVETVAVREYLGRNGVELAY